MSGGVSDCPPKCPRAEPLPNDLKLPRASTLAPWGALRAGGRRPTSAKEGKFPTQATAAAAQRSEHLYQICGLLPRARPTTSFIIKSNGGRGPGNIRRTSQTQEHSATFEVPHARGLPVHLPRGLWWHLCTEAVPLWLGRRQRRPCGSRRRVGRPGNSGWRRLFRVWGRLRPRAEVGHAERKIARAAPNTILEHGELLARGQKHWEYGRVTGLSAGGRVQGLGGRPRRPPPNPSGRGPAAVRPLPAADAPAAASAT